MKRSFPFAAPVQDVTQRALRRELYDRSIELYEEEQQPVEALHTLLDALNPAFRPKYGDAAGQTFRIPHGSIVVQIAVADGRLTIEADFLQLPAKGRVAMLRQVADLNINRLRLAYFVKQDDRLKLRYSCPLTESHPIKILGILNNICYIGDRYDDEFCTKFGATRCYEPHVTPYPAETTDRLYTAVQTLGRQELDIVKDFVAQRRYGYAWTVLRTFLFQLGYFVQPQGQLMNDLDDILEATDEELPYAELVTRGTTFIEQLLARPKEELAADFYFVDTLVSQKHPASLQHVQEDLAETFDKATAAMQAKDFEEAVIRMTHGIYMLHYYHDMQDELNRLFAEVLEASADRPLEEAADLLWHAYNRVAEGEIEPDEAPAVGIPAEAAAAAAAMQEQLNSTMGGLQNLQQQMVEAMTRGDMAEYMRLATEMQQQVMSGMFKQ